MITDDEQERELIKLVKEIKQNEMNGHDKFNDYVNLHGEKILLAYAIERMKNAGFMELKNENSKYLLMAGLNIIDCISKAKYRTTR